ncbi:hypothetical protein ABEB36_010731 [Hypothenemus hampei]|uniref:MADF domain-containing protein n=1 Tax=Hypothenemus hampei TaxID=57062 RepID=A0ABD1EDL9_HYPHA
MEDFDERLIKIVKDCEMLYNKKCSGYKNIVFKTKKWQEISESLNSTSEKCIRRWKSLRDRYTRYLKKENLPSGSGTRNHSTWNLFHQMDFLRDHVASRSTSGNMIHFPESVEDDSSIGETTSPSESDYTLEDPASSIASTPQNPRKRTKLDDVHQAFKEGMTTFQEFMRTKITPPNPKTPGEIFGQTVANIFDGLSERLQREAKIEIMKYLLTLQEDEPNEQ